MSAVKKAIPKAGDRNKHIKKIIANNTEQDMELFPLKDLNINLKNSLKKLVKYIVITLYIYSS